jgi:serine/threonine protein kinase
MRGGLNIERRADPIIGTMLAGYRVDAIAGKGGMGVVYRATDLTLDRQVAIKLVAPALAQNKEFKQRFETESRLAASLDHPNVIPIYRAGQEGGVLFQVMRYVAGADLRTLIVRDGPIAPPRAVEITAQVAAALDAAHSCGLVHRDVKPANILLAGDHAYLTDFGLSKRIAAAEDQTESDAFVGTLHYIAPEQIRNQAVDGRADIYALGCVVFHMLTGTVPFPMDSDEATLWAHLSTAPPAVSERRAEVPAALDAVVARALSKAPNDRHPAASEFASELRSALEQPSKALRARAETRVPLQAPLIAPSGAQLINRVQETARIKRYAAEVEASASGLILIAGEAGIGKTRLATELADVLYASRWTVLYGRAAIESVVPYEPFVEAIRHYLTHHPLPVGALDPALAPEVSELARIMPELRIGAAPGLYPEDDIHLQRYRLFEGVVALLAWILAETPVCLVLDDLHWADRATVLLLRHVLRSTKTARLLVVATCRDEQIAPDSGLAELLADLRRGQRLERVALVGMDAHDTGTLVGQVAGFEPPEQFAELLQEQTGGNPFFIEEVVRGLSTGDEQTRFDRAALERIGVPEGVKELITSRLRHAEPAAADMLAAAGVVGQSFSPAVIARVLGRSLDDVLAMLDAGVAAGLVVEQPAEHRFQFRHALVREALQETFSASRRALLHLRAGEALEAEGAPAAELALHFWESREVGGAEKAIRYALRAAEQARHSHADHEAVVHYQRALEASELVEHPDKTLVSRLMLGLGEAQMRAGDSNAARTTLARTAELADELGLPDVLASAALNVGAFNLSSGTVDELLVDLLERALERSEGPTRARLLARLGTALYWSDLLERRKMLAAEAEQLARDSSDPATLAYVLGYNHVTFWSPDRADVAMREATEVIELAEAAGEDEMALKARSWRINHLLTVGLVDDAFDDIDRFGELARELRQPRCLWYAPLFEAMRALLRGRFTEAERLGAQSARIGQEVDQSLSALLSGAQLLYLRWWQGRLEELAPAVRGFADNYPAMPAWRCALALIRRELEDQEGARKVLAGIRPDRLPRDNIWLVSMTCLAEAAAWAGETLMAAELERMLLPFSDLVAVSPDAACLSPVSRLLGLLAAAQGKHEAARTLLERAEDQCLSLQAPALLALTQIDHAELLAKEDDAPGAQRLARQALGAGEELGMARVVTRAERILGR